MSDGTAEGFGSSSNEEAQRRGILRIQGRLGRVGRTGTMLRRSKAGQSRSVARLLCCAAES